MVLSDCPSTKFFPEIEIPLVCDMSSDILTPLAVIGAIIPIIIIVINFIVIKIKVSKMAQTIMRHRNQLKRRRSHQELKAFGGSILQIEKGVTRTTSLVIGASLLLSLPAALTVTIYPIDTSNNQVPELHITFYILFWLAAFTNPLIYVFRNPRSQAGHYAHAVETHFYLQHYLQPIEHALARPGGTFIFVYSCPEAAQLKLKMCYS